MRKSTKDSKQLKLSLKLPMKICDHPFRWIVLGKILWLLVGLRIHLIALSLVIVEAFTDLKNKCNEEAASSKRSESIKEVEEAPTYDRPNTSV